MALVDRFKHARGVDDDHGKVDAVGEVRDRLIGLEALDLAALGIDRVDAAFEAELNEALEKIGADGMGPRGGADDGNGPGLQNGVEQHGMKFLWSRVEESDGASRPCLPEDMFFDCIEAAGREASAEMLNLRASFRIEARTS